MATAKKPSPIQPSEPFKLPMVIMGIDPGLATIGVAFATWDGIQAHHMYHGVIRTSSELSLERRLSEIRHDIRILVAEYKPQLVCLEEFFMPRFKKNANGFNTAKAIGAIMTIPGDLGIPVNMYPAPVLKDAACGKSKAEKEDVMAGVQEFYRLAQVKPSHAADALGAIMCYIRGKKPLGKELGE